MIDCPEVHKLRAALEGSERDLREARQRITKLQRERDEARKWADELAAAIELAFEESRKCASADLAPAQA